MQAREPRLYRVVAPRFVAGVIVARGVVTHCAPILRRYRIVGATLEHARAVCARNRWDMREVVPAVRPAGPWLAAAVREQGHPAHDARSPGDGLRLAKHAKSAYERQS